MHGDLHALQGAGGYVNAGVQPDPSAIQLVTYFRDLAVPGAFLLSTMDELPHRSRHEPLLSDVSDRPVTDSGVASDS